VRRILLSLLRQLVLLPSLALVALIRLLKWLIAPLALLPQLLIGVPLTLLHLRQPLRPRFLPVQLVELPDTAWIEFTDAAEALAADGFIHYGDFRCNELVRNAVAWLRLMGQPLQGVGAIAVYIESGDGIQSARRFIEFATEFHDGRVLTLNNLGLPYSLPAPDYLARFQLKDVWEPRALYVLHHGLVTALAQPVNLAKLEQAVNDPAGLLAASYQREVQALLARGWLRADTTTGSARLGLWGAITGVWRQAWPLASLVVRAADRHTRRLLAAHGLHTAGFTGAAPGIVVARHRLPEPAQFATVRAGYALALPLAQRTDLHAVLEAVVIELDRDTAGAVVLLEFRYSFRSCVDEPQRRIRRLRGFDVLLAPEVGTLAVTAMEREFEQADNAEEWAELTASTPLAPLTLGAWLQDLDQILPTALTALAAQAGTDQVLPDSAALYGNEDGAPYWQVVAWNGADDPPLHVMVDARSGLLAPAVNPA